jgi:hypothetical protein
MAQEVRSFDIYCKIPFTEVTGIKVIKSLGSNIKKIKYILLEIKFIHFYKLLKLYIK